MEKTNEQKEISASLRKDDNVKIKQNIYVADSKLINLACGECVHTYSSKPPNPHIAKMWNVVLCIMQIS